jgi:hypothetical protein
MVGVAAFRGTCCTRGSCDFAIRSLALASPLRLRLRRSSESLEPIEKLLMLATLMNLVTSLPLIEAVPGSGELSVRRVKSCPGWAWSLAVFQAAQ